MNPQSASATDLLLPALDPAKYASVSAALTALIEKYRAASTQHPQAFAKSMLNSAAGDLDKLLKAGASADGIKGLLARWEHAAATHPDAVSKAVLEFCMAELKSVQAHSAGGAASTPKVTPAAPAKPAEPAKPAAASGPALSTPGGKPMTGHGLSQISFSVMRPQVAADERIEFRFAVSNPGTETITLGYAGCVVYDAAGQNLRFHASWTEWQLEPGKAESWFDGLAIGTPGTYTLVFAFCVPGIDACNAGKGQWYEPVEGVSVRVL